MNNCSKCQELNAVRSIKTPGDLQQILHLTKHKLTIGDLVETVTAPQGVASFSQDPFSTLAANGPWPDVLQYSFRCNACEQSFRLAVETYHGTGGTWSPLN
jgi:hypothetical protein